jgi:hypothetical protein
MRWWSKPISQLTIERVEKRDSPLAESFDDLLIDDFQPAVKPINDEQWNPFDTK